MDSDFDPAAVVTFTNNGKNISMFLPNRQDHIQKVIAQGKMFYEDEMLEDIRLRVKPGQWAIDVGANIGNHTVFFGAVCNLNVYSLEPCEYFKSIITKNIELNDIGDKVTFLNKAAGNRSAFVKMITADENNIGGSRIDSHLAGDTEVIRLDDLDIPGKLALLKIDVEGEEQNVVEGALGIIKQHLPLIYVELLSIDHYSAVKEMLEEFGYIDVDIFNWSPTYLFLPVKADKQIEIIVDRCKSLKNRIQQDINNTASYFKKCFENQEVFYRQLDQNRRESQNSLAKIEENLKNYIENKFEILSRKIERQSYIYEQIFIKIIQELEKK